MQIQYTGKPESLINILKDLNQNQRLTRKYEIVLKGKENKKYQMMEYLFSNEGKFEDKAIIIMKIPIILNTNFKLGISTLFLLLGNSILSQNKTFGGLPQLNINKILSEKWRLNLKLNLEINFMNLLRNLKILLNFRT